MKDVFDAEYKDKFLKAGLLEPCGGELQHLISDAATMQIVRWTDGGFGMAAHNYDGDMLTDQIAQVRCAGAAVRACVTSGGRLRSATARGELSTPRALVCRCTAAPGS